MTGWQWMTNGTSLVQTFCPVPLSSDRRLHSLTIKALSNRSWPDFRETTSYPFVNKALNLELLHLSSLFVSHAHHLAVNILHLRQTDKWAVITALCFVLCVVVTLPNCRRRRASATINNGQPPKFLLFRGYGGLKSTNLRATKTERGRERDRGHSGHNYLHLLLLLDECCE